jgi:predicted phage-related endonuclease
VAESAVVAVTALVPGSFDWLRARLLYLGSSEIAAIYPAQADSPTNTGTLHPWLSEWKLWAIKTGKISESEVDGEQRLCAMVRDEPHLYWGCALEPVIRLGYSQLTQRRVSEGRVMQTHPTVACMCTNTDGEIFDVEHRDGAGVLEIKTASVFDRADWFDARELDPPLYYQVQVQAELACTGLSWASLCVYFAGERQPLRWRDIDRNPTFIADLEQRAAAWWHKHVTLGEMPPIDGSDSTREAIRQVYPQDDGTIVRLPDSFAPVLDRITAATKMVEHAKHERALAYNAIAATMGPAKYGQVYDGRGVIFSTDTNGVRRFRVVGVERMKKARRETRTRYPTPVAVPSGIEAVVNTIASYTWGAKT